MPRGKKYVCCSIDQTDRVLSILTPLIMDPVVMDINWTATIVGAITAFALGALWYSPTMFGTKWMKAVGITEKTKCPTGYAMTSQAFGTFFYSWLIGVSAAMNSLHLAAVVIFAIAALIKANGFFANKKMDAIKIETSYVLAMGIVMVLAHAVL